MARHVRRLIFGFAAFCLGLVLLALVALWWFLEPERLRARIEAQASAALGRPVRIETPLRWSLGPQLAIESGAGSVANAPGFAGPPLAGWSRIRFGLALRPLLRREVRIDRLQVDGLALDLARDAAGRDNWQLPGLAAGPDADAGSMVFHLGEVVLRDATVRYRDTAATADWRLEALQFAAKLPADLSADTREFRDVDLSLRLQGGPLADEVPVTFSTPLLRLAGAAVAVPDFSLAWADARVLGAVELAGTAPLAVQGRVEASAPSLRALLATVGAAPAPMRDPTVLGAFALRTGFQATDTTAQFDALSLRLDDTTLTGSVRLPALAPPALRFTLAADQAVLDRYLEPDDAQGEPLTLPLAQLRALDAQGVLTIERATLAGAAARQVRIDVE